MTFFMKLSTKHPLSDIGGVTMASLFTKHRKHGKWTKMATIFCHGNFSGWLAKFCPFLTVLVYSVSHSENRRFGVLINKHEKRQNCEIPASFGCLSARFDRQSDSQNCQI